MSVETKIYIDNLAELDSAELPFDEFFYLVVKNDGVKYQFRVRLASKDKNLICFGSGAYDPAKLKPPIFRRHSWQGEFRESVIYYNDPTLYVNSDMRLGWCVGKNSEWYMPVIRDIILKIAGKNDIKPENMLFFGSSGGGFSAVILSTMIKKSQVMVNNPQLFLKNYEETHFNRMIQSCFDNQDLDSILDEYGYRFDVVEVFKRENHMPHMIYLINSNSKTDIKDQLLPFINRLDSFTEFDDQLDLLVYHAEGGHQGVYDSDKTITLLKNHFKEYKLTTRETLKVKKELLSIANTRSYRMAYFLHRFNHEFLKGKNGERKDFLRWLANKLVGKKSGLEYKHNPLLGLVYKYF